MLFSVLLCLRVHLPPKIYQICLNNRKRYRICPNGNVVLLPQEQVAFKDVMCREQYVVQGQQN